MNHVNHKDSPDIDDLERGIAVTRAEMGETLQALERHLNPHALGEAASAEIDHIEERVKAAVKEGLDEAKEAVAHGLTEARERIKKDVDEAITTTKQNIRRATLGRVEDLATQAGDVMNETRETLVETVRQNPIPAALAGIGIVWLLMNRSTTAKRRRDGSGFGVDGGPAYGRYPGAYGGYGGMTYGGAGYGQESMGNKVGEVVSRAEHTIAGTTTEVVRRASDVAHRAGDAVHHAGEHVGETFSKVGHSVTVAAQDAMGISRDAIGHGVEAAANVAHQTRDAASRIVQGATDATSQFAHGAVESAGNLAHRAEELAQNAAMTARDQAMRVEQGVESAWDANPLAFGAAVIAVGAAIGYALPRTEREDAIMGAVRDKLVHSASEMTTGAVRSIEHMADDAGKVAKQALTAG